MCRLGARSGLYSIKWLLHASARYYRGSTYHQRRVISHKAAVILDCDLGKGMFALHSYWIQPLRPNQSVPTMIPAVTGLLSCMKPPVVYRI